MRKTYEGLAWPEIMETVEHANALGLLKEVRLVPVEGQAAPAAPDYDLTVRFDGFDAEPAREDRGLVGVVARDVVARDHGPELVMPMSDPSGLRFGEMLQRTVTKGPPDEEAPEDGTGKEPAEQPAGPEPTTEEIPEPEIEVSPETDVEPDPEPPAIAAEDAGEEETRLCTKCGPTQGPKPVSEFAPNGNSRDGLSKICRPCRSGMGKAASEEKQRKRRDRQQEHSGEILSPPLKNEAREKFVEAGRASHAHAPPQPQSAPEPVSKVQKKRCEVCGPELGPRPLTEFAKRANKGEFPDGRAKVCRECSLKAGGANPSPASSPADEDLGGDWEERLAEIPRGPGPEPEKVRERFCANGEDCMAVPHTGRPTKLNSANKSDTCHGCEERATGRFGAGA